VVGRTGSGGTGKPTLILGSTLKAPIDEDGLDQIAVLFQNSVWWTAADVGGWE